VIAVAMVLYGRALKDGHPVIFGRLVWRKLLVGFQA
jgi:hypothetical protein